MHRRLKQDTSLDTGVGHFGQLSQAVISSNTEDSLFKDDSSLSDFLGFSLPQVDGFLPSDYL